MLQLSRDLDCQYKTAFVLAHKLREAIASEIKGATLSGIVEVDGAILAATSVRQTSKKTGSTAACENQTGIAALCRCPRTAWPHHYDREENRSGRRCLC